MKTKSLAFAVALVLSTSAASTAATAEPLKPFKGEKRSWVVGGINIDAVDWASLCPSIQPLTLSRGGITCARVHPASTIWQRFYDVTGWQNEPAQLNCKMLEQEYERAIRPRRARFPGDETVWNTCYQMFKGELEARDPSTVVGRRVNYDDMPFETWRSKYFAKYMLGE